MAPRSLLEILRTRQLTPEQIDELDQLLIRWDNLGDKYREIAAGLAQVDQRFDPINRQISHAKWRLQLARDGWEHWMSQKQKNWERFLLAESGQSLSNRNKNSLLKPS
jgi:hypothetical protein